MTAPALKGRFMPRGYHDAAGKAIAYHFNFGGADQLRNVVNQLSLTPLRRLADANWE